MTCTGVNQAIKPDAKRNPDSWAKQKTLYFREKPKTVKTDQLDTAFYGLVWWEWSSRSKSFTGLDCDWLRTVTGRGKSLHSTATLQMSYKKWKKKAKTPCPRTADRIWITLSWLRQSISSMPYGIGNPVTWPGRRENRLQYVNERISCTRQGAKIRQPLENGKNSTSQQRFFPKPRRLWFKSMLLVLS